MDLSRATPGAELNAEMALKVMGWKMKPKARKVIMGDGKVVDGIWGKDKALTFVQENAPGYSENMADAFLVVRRVNLWLFSKREMFLRFISFEFPLDNHCHATWPDVFFILQPLNICRAALKVVYVYEKEGAKTEPVR